MSHGPEPLSPIAESIDPFQYTSRQQLSETQPLLPPSTTPRKPFYRARPLWLVPFALVTALVRGMTLAPRVEVYTHLACNQFHRHYNHTVTPPTTLDDYSTTSLYSTLDPLGPHLSFSHALVNFSTLQDTPIGPPNCKQLPEVQATAARIQTTLTITMGILSALTTGWWGQFGQRFGRTRVFGIASLGLIFTYVLLPPILPLFTVQQGHHIPSCPNSQHPLLHPRPQTPHRSTHHRRSARRTHHHPSLPLLLRIRLYLPRLARSHLFPIPRGFVSRFRSGSEYRVGDYQAQWRADQGRV